MDYEVWRRARSIEEEFLNSLRYVVDLFGKICSLSGDDQQEYVRRMNNFQNSFAYEKFIFSAVRRMVTPLAMSNYNTWRKAAREQTKSKQIYQALMQEIQEGLHSDIESQVLSNAALIRTLPNDVAQKVVLDIRDYTFTGERATTIAELIRDKTAQHAGASARLIARTEVSKTTTALTRARSENLGLKWYIWRTAQDGDRVRNSHRIMEGVLVRWDNPPSPEALVGEKSEGNYHAGEIWNCRCYPEPLIELDDIQWPAKVYLNGVIRTMGRREFEQIA